MLIKDPTFKDVLDTAIKCESAEQHTSLIQDAVANDGSVFQMNRRNTVGRRTFNNNRNNRADKNNGDREPCWRCGRTNHWPSNCYFKEKECSHCHRKGHKASMCSKKKSQQPTGNVRALANVGEDHPHASGACDDSQVNCVSKNYFI